MKRHQVQVEPGKVLDQLGQDETEAFAKSWVAVFGQKPAPHMTDYLWHVFSYGSYPSVALQDALLAYASATSPEYVVLSNDGDEAFITDQRPTSCSFRDYYVFPKNLAWTMAFTHEDGWLGPFFATHGDFDKLNGENLTGVRKAEDAAEAKQKGYS